LPGLEQYNAETVPENRSRCVTIARTGLFSKIEQHKRQ
jgi:hypothetical protein